jgi:HTH-type transcriptional regulator/antitoxin HigA
MKPTNKQYNPAIYGAMLADALPVVIESDSEYERIEAIFNDLMDKGEDNLSPEQTRLFALLAKLMEDYERETLPALEKSSPLETLKFLMAENNLKQKDLVEIFGTQSIASDVLSGKRSISKTAAVRLAERFKVSAELFI